MAKEKINIDGASDLEKKKKQKMMAVLIGGAVVLIFILMSGVESPPPPKPQTGVVEPVEFAPLSEADWISNAQIELSKTQDALATVENSNSEIRNQLDQVSRQVDQLLEEFSDQKAEITAVERRTERTLEDAERLIEEARIEASRIADEARAQRDADPRTRRRPTRGPSVIDGVVLPPRAPGAQRDQEAEAGDAGSGSTPTRQIAPNGTSVAPARTPQPQSYGRGNPFVIRGVDAPENKEISSAMQENVAVQESYEANEFAGFLPAGSFVQGSLMHGMEAGASEYTRSNPQPVMIRLSSAAITPGDASYDLKGCVAIGNSYGDLSTHRAYVTISRLSCLDMQNGFVLEAPVTAYAVDFDSVQGLSGVVVRRNGQIIAKGLVAGIGEGIAQVAQVAGQANAQSLTAPITGAVATSTTNIDVQGLAQAGAFGGVSNSANILSQYFLNEAQQIFPAIQVPPGRNVSVVFQQGTALRWEPFRGGYRKVVQPS